MRDGPCRPCLIPIGYGFLEPLCISALADELLARGHRVAREASVGVWYKEREIGTQRLDLIVNVDPEPTFQCVIFTNDHKNGTPVRPVRS